MDSFQVTIEELLKKYTPFLQRLWSARKRLAIINGAGFIVSVLYLLFLVSPYYDSTVSVLPDYGNKTMPSGMSDLASLAGINIGMNSPTDIYENLIQSEAVVGPAIYSLYKTEEFADSVNLIQYFKIKKKTNLPPDLDKRRMFLSCFERLRKDNIRTSVSKDTRILDVTVRMPESKLSADVVDRLVESLDLYVRTTRKSYALNQQYYLEKRLGQVTDSLRNCENALRDFQERNRMASTSPALRLDESRLTRNVQVMEQTYLQLTQQLELTKLDIIRDTPVINVKEYAKDPILKKGPNRKILLILMIAGIFLASTLYYGNIDKVHLFRTILGGWWKKEILESKSN